MTRWKVILFFILFFIGHVHTYGMDSDDNTRKAGPPKIPISKGNKVKIFDENIQINEDNDGNSFFGTQLERITTSQCDQEPKRPVNLKNTLIYTLSNMLDLRDILCVSSNKENISFPVVTEAQLDEICTPNKNIESPELQKKQENSDEIISDHAQLPEKSVHFSHQENTSQGKYIPMQQENVDEREKIEDPAKWPWIVHGHLRIQYGDSKNFTIYIGSGVLISECCVLTAAHNLWKNGKIPNAISFFVGVKDGTAQSIVIDGQNIDEFKAQNIAINETYINALEDEEKDDKSLWAADFGLVFLEKNLGKYIGIADFGIIDDENKNKNLKIRISGYPTYIKNKPILQKSLYSMSSTVNEFQNNYLHYNVHTTKGQSGSGVYKEKEKEILDENFTPFCFAIHTYGPHAKGNIGTLITKETLDTINSWIKYFEK